MVIFAMSIVPFGIAWYLAQNPDKLQLGTNNGELITPPQVTAASDFTGKDTFSAENIHELSGHWILVSPQAGACEEVCRDALYKSHQLTLMMGKDIARIRRLALLLDSSVQLPAQWQDDARLLKALPSTALQEKLQKLLGQPVPSGSLLIMDPLGNLMMKYAPGFDPYKVRNDLSKLLRISQIG